METLVLRLLPRRKHGIALRYGATAAIILITALLRYGLKEPLQQFPLLLFIPAIFLCALLFGRGSGFFATILSAAIAAGLFMGTPFTFRVGVQNLLALALFVLIGFIMAAVTEALRRAIARLDQSEKSKALLLDELAHRTKNNLAIISAAITLQANAAEDPAVRNALNAANARVLVVAQAQDRLRDDQDSGLVDLPDYVASLCQGLRDLLRDIRAIAVQVHCDPLRVPGSVAVHVGLIVNELVTNSLKYAYPDERGGTIAVEIRSDGARIAITVGDDGVGCPSSNKPGLGSKLVRLLAKRLGGSVVREDAKPGCRTRVTLDGRAFVGEARPKR